MLPLRVTSRRLRIALVGASSLLFLAGVALVAPDGATASTTYTLWSGSDTSSARVDSDTSSVEVGLRVRSNTGGTVGAIRFLKATGDPASRHSVSIWNSRGERIGAGFSTAETASGWQRVTLNSPVSLRAGRTYVVSYHTTRYMATPNFFKTDATVGPLTVFGTQNGVYRYGSSPAFPTNTFGASNYWVDLEFTTGSISTSTTTSTTVKATTSTTSPTTSTTQSPTTSTTTSTTAAPATTTTSVATSTGGYPSAANTGVPSGITLTPYSGSCDFRTDNQVIDSKTINCGGILVYARNVVIKNSVVNSAIMTNASVASLRVEDSNINGGQTSWGALDGFNVTVLRSEVTGGQHSVHCASNCLVQDSYLHDQYNDPNASFHNNAFISNGGSNITLRHNTVWCSTIDNANGGGCTADVSFFGDFDPISKVIVDGNYFHATASGGYCGTFGYNPQKAYGSNPTGVVVTNNVFEKGSNGKCGVWGPATSFLSGGSGNVWSNNTWVGGETVNP